MMRHVKTHTQGSQLCIARREHYFYFFEFFYGFTFTNLCLLVHFLDLSDLAFEPNVHDENDASTGYGLDERKWSAAAAQYKKM